MPPARLLTASELVGLDLDADLVILSACNSGGPGGTTAGESLSGLARAFFYAGARSLLVTHWSVNDQVAAFLVADTLRRMKENPALGVAGALARRTARDAGGRRQGPAGGDRPSVLLGAVRRDRRRWRARHERRSGFKIQAGRAIVRAGPDTQPGSPRRSEPGARMAETIETLGKYEIKRTLGKGAMGTVYEGWDPIIARRVAIKTVRVPDTQDDPETEEALARFRREAQAAGRLTHPNIVGVFDYGETGDIAYIVMEYVDGPSVKSLVDKQERFAIADTMRIMTDLLNGLQFSHDRGVVHRDIKPANIMLTKDGQAKIADFGIARIESSSMTQAGTVLGTPAYMSPEQFMGQVVDARTDIYSSGVLLYQLLTGERPFEGGMSAIMHKALNTDPPLPSQITVTCPPAFDGVVRKAMAKRPEDRFQSAIGVPGSVARGGGRPAFAAARRRRGRQFRSNDGCRRARAARRLRLPRPRDRPPRRQPPAQSLRRRSARPCR